MIDSPFIELVVETLNLMHPRFAQGDGLRSFRNEFYHQFRHLWDRAIPVRLGLGHVVIQAEQESDQGSSPDFLFWRLAEQSRAEERLGAVSLAWLVDETVLDLVFATLAQSRRKYGYPSAICVLLGRQSEIPQSGLPVSPSVTSLLFDLELWRVDRNPISPQFPGV